MAAPSYLGPGIPAEALRVVQTIASPKASHRDKSGSTHANALRAFRSYPCRVRQLGIYYASITAAHPLSLKGPTALEVCLREGSSFGGERWRRVVRQIQDDNDWLRSRWVRLRSPTGVLY